ncbi:hypothetical protein HDU82_006483 [Entophlyctis luteolus]|nr:hypothetical protein HDU82_006483 [Entophlyctis luteolus]
MFFNALLNQAWTRARDALLTGTSGKHCDGLPIPTTGAGAVAGALLPLVLSCANYHSYCAGYHGSACAPPEWHAASTGAFFVSAASAAWLAAMLAALEEFAPLAVVLGQRCRTRTDAADACGRDDARPRRRGCWCLSCAGLGTAVRGVDWKNSRGALLLRRWGLQDGLAEYGPDFGLKEL